MTDHYQEAVWIVACLEDGEKPDRTAGSSIYPAVDNMLLATRAVCAILPIGWPMGRFGPLGRGPLKDVVFQNQWGKPYPGP